MSDQYQPIDFNALTEQEALDHVVGLHHSSVATQSRAALADSLDDTRTWVDPNGYRLSDRLWKQSELQRRRIDDMLREGIRRGDDANAVARNLEKFLHPAYRPSRTSKGRIIRDERKGVVTYAPYRGGQGSLVSRRLVRTEVTRTFGQATQVTAKALDQPVGWDLSARHPKTDICDNHASGSSTGLPRGTYHVDEVPSYPAHPLCLCTLTVRDTRSDEQVAADLRAKYGLDQPLEEQVVAEVDVTSIRTLPQQPAAVPTFANEYEAFRWYTTATDAGVTPGTISLDSMRGIANGLNRSVVRFNSKLSEVKLNGAHANNTVATYARRLAEPTRPGSMGFSVKVNKTPRAARLSAAQEEAIFASDKAYRLEKLDRQLAQIRTEGVRKEQLTLRRDTIEASERWSVSSTSADPIQAVTVHEGGHAIYFQHGLEKRWLELTDSLPAPMKARVSEYALANPQELFAETFAAWDEGLFIPQPLLDALLEVLSSVPI